MKRSLLITVTVLIAAGWTVGCSTYRKSSALPPIEAVDELPPIEDPTPTLTSNTSVGETQFEPVTTAAQDTSATSVRYYTINRGDTLWSVALLHYGNGQRWRDIQAANPGIEPRRLHIGQEIVVP